MKRKGFTLIEMVIVVTLVLILSSISVPVFKSYIRDARLSEGYALAAAIRDAQIQYYNEHGNFLFSGHCNGGYSFQTSYEPVLGIDARGNKYYTLFNINNYNREIYTSYLIYVYSNAPLFAKNIICSYSPSTGSSLTLY